MISYYAFHYHISSCAYLSLINFPRHLRLIYSFTAKIFGVFFLSLCQWTERQVLTICIWISLWKDCVSFHLNAINKNSKLLVLLGQIKKKMSLNSAWKPILMKILKYLSEFNIFTTSIGEGLPCYWTQNSFYR